MFDTIDRDTDVARLRDAIDGLDVDHDLVTGRELSERLIRLLEAKERLEALITRLAGRWDRKEPWRADGALSGTAWLASRAALPKAKARKLIRNGRLTVDHIVVDEALASGDVTTEHVEAITDAAGKHRQDLVAESITALVDSAGGLSIDDYRTVTRQWAALADDQVADRDFEKQHERRGLYVSPTLDGTVLVDGLLDADAGATVITALDRLAPPDATAVPDGPRSLPQRRADALTDLCQLSLQGIPSDGVAVDEKDSIPAPGPTTINVVVDLATLLGDDHDDAELGDVRCDVERVGPVGRSTLERLGCDAGFCRVLMDGPSVILDMGRSRRLASAAQRRALAIRDRGCVFEGCGRPARWCDVHHLDAWLRGGLTDLGRMVLLCRRHHVLCHEAGWTIQRHRDGSTVTLPPGYTPPNRPPP